MPNSKSRETTKTRNIPKRKKGTPKRQQLEVEEDIETFSPTSNSKSKVMVEDVDEQSTEDQASNSESESENESIPNNQLDKKVSNDNESEHKQVDFSLLEGVGIHESSDESDHEANMETIALSKLPAQVISTARNDEAALKQKLSEIALFTKDAKARPLPFWESLSVSMALDAPLSDKLAIDDLERERKFAELATTATHSALALLRQNNVKFRRPDDYFAEMVKTDTHMEKVKSRIISETDKIEAAQKRRNNRDISKNRRKVRSEQLQLQQQKKQKVNEEIEAFSKLRKQRLHEKLNKNHENDDDEGDEFPIELLEVEQLDVDNRFQSQKDIVSGNKKAWKPQKNTGNGKKDRHNRKSSGQNPDKGKFRNSRSPQQEQQAKKGPGVSEKGVKKPRGPKKRLGRSRRFASKK